MSQQPYQQPGQPGQPGGYPQGGQPPQAGYPQGYQQPGYGGGYPGGGSPYSGGAGRGNPMSNAAGLAPILLILGYVVAGLGILAGILSFTLDGFTGTYKFQQFLSYVMFGLGFGGVLLALSALLKSRSSA